MASIHRQKFIKWQSKRLYLHISGGSPPHNDDLAAMKAALRRLMRRSRTTRQAVVVVTAMMAFVFMVPQDMFNVVTAGDDTVFQLFKQAFLAVFCRKAVTRIKFDDAVLIFDEK